MAWTVNESGESVWDDGNNAFRQWLDQYKVQRWTGEGYEDDGYNIPGVGKVTDVQPWADFQNYRAFGPMSTPETYRAGMFEGGGQVIDTPVGKVFVGTASRDAPEGSAQPGAGFGGMLPLLVGGGIGAAGAAAGFGLGGLGGAGGAEAGLGALNSFDTGAMADILGTNIGSGAGAGGASGLDAIMSGWNPTGDLGEYAGYTAANTVPTGAAATAAATGVGGAGNAASALSRILNGNASTQDWLSLAGQLGSVGLGVYGANQQAGAANDLYDRFFSLGAPYRQSLASLEANPQGFYSSPMVQGALQQGSDALARSLSAKVGNPILNPTALQEMQNYTTRGLLDAYNNRFSQLAGAGQLGVSQSAGLGSQAVSASGGVPNALGAGLSSVFGQEQNYAQQLIDLLKNRPRSSGTSLV